MAQAADTPKRAGRPAITAALTDVIEAPWGYAAACPLCGLPLTLSEHRTGWLALCDGGCTSADVLRHCHAECRRLAAAHRHAWLALRLALTPGAWAGLLAGEPVQPQAIDQAELARLRGAGLWR